MCINLMQTHHVAHFSGHATTTYLHRDRGITVSAVLVVLVVVPIPIPPPLI